MHTDVFGVNRGMALPHKHHVLWDLGDMEGLVQGCTGVKSANYQKYSLEFGDVTSLFSLNKRAICPDELYIVLERLIITP